MSRVIAKMAAHRLLRRELPHIAELIYGAWHDYMAYPEEVRLDHTPRTRASAVHDHMVSRARRVFSVSVNAHCMEQGGLFVVMLYGRIALRFKKLDDDLRASNIPTQQSIEFCSQELYLPGIKKVTYLQAGYTLNRTQTGLSGAYVACPDGIGNHWDIPLSIADSAENVVKLPVRRQTAPRFVSKVELPTEKRGDGEDV